MSLDNKTNYVDCACGEGVMLPIYDNTNTQPPLIIQKGWVCSSKNCGHNVMFQSGKLITMEIQNFSVAR